MWYKLRVSELGEGDAYLDNRNGWFQYVRRIPTRLQGFYESSRIRISLGTKDPIVARARRDELAGADEEYWAYLKHALAMKAAGETLNTDAAKRQYNVARARAMSAGVRYYTIDQLAGQQDLRDLVRRAIAIEDRSTSDGRLNPRDIDAMLGGVEEPKEKVSDAFRMFETEIAPARWINKSPAQRKLALNTKKRSINYFISEMGDMAMSNITRDQAREYFAWWTERVIHGDAAGKQYSPNTANRHIGDMRKLYADYYAQLGDEDRLNPFRKLNFREKTKPAQPAFEDKWVREHILVPGAFGGVMEDIVYPVLMMIETGCRPSEIVNLRPEDIVLDHPVPHIRIAEREDRETKTDDSIRAIPLVGVSLEAARRAPQGFPHYHDKSSAFSAAAGAAFRRRKLFPTNDHVIYSFRHAFDKRMQEANIDYGLRCLLMGHKIDRPKYGDGGGLKYRRDEMLRIAHAVPEGFFASFGAATAAA